VDGERLVVPIFIRRQDRGPSTSQQPSPNFIRSGQLKKPYPVAGVFIRADERAKSRIL
jgi:hypothetical protein